MPIFLLILALLLSPFEPVWGVTETSPSTVSTSIPDDLNLLIGKRVVVGRMPLCTPGTYAVDFAHAGQSASVINFNANRAMSGLGANMATLQPSVRAMMDDARKGGKLEFQFTDGARLDTCGDLLFSQLVQGMSLADGQVIALPSAASTATVANQPASGQAAPGTSFLAQSCPVTIIKVKSGSGLGHALVEALTTSQLERQLDSTMNGGQSKTYLDLVARNASDRNVSAFEFTAVYLNAMGDVSGSYTFISQNTKYLKPGEQYKGYSMNRNEFMQNGTGQIKIFINRVRFSDKSFWQDNGSQSCSSETRLK
jgi:hypothetical protein